MEEGIFVILRRGPAALKKGLRCSTLVGFLAAAALVLWVGTVGAEEAPSNADLYKMILELKAGQKEMKAEAAASRAEAEKYEAEADAAKEELRKTKRELEAARQAGNVGAKCRASQLLAIRAMTDPDCRRVDLGLVGYVPAVAPAGHFHHCLLWLRSAGKAQSNISPRARLI